MKHKWNEKLDVFNAIRKSGCKVTILTKTDVITEYLCLDKDGDTRCAPHNSIWKILSGNYGTPTSLLFGNTRVSAASILAASFKTVDLMQNPITMEYTEEVDSAAYAFSKYPNAKLLYEVETTVYLINNMVHTMREYAETMEEAVEIQQANLNYGIPCIQETLDVRSIATMYVNQKNIDHVIATILPIQFKSIEDRKDNLVPKMEVDLFHPANKFHDLLEFYRKQRKYAVPEYDGVNAVADSFPTKYAHEYFEIVPSNWIDLPEGIGRIADFAFVSKYKGLAYVMILNDNGTYQLKFLEDACEFDFS